MKIAMILLVALATATVSSGQDTPDHAADRLGPHSNGGRGCPICHAPHRASEPQGCAPSSSPCLTTAAKEDLLAATRESPSRGIDLSDETRVAPMIPNYDQQEDEVRGISMCLSCHDGNIAKNTMLKETTYDRRSGLQQGGKSQVESFTTIVNNPGLNDERFFNVDHPVGPSANLGSTDLNPQNVVFSTDAASGIQNVSIVADTPEAYFAANYGFPALTKGRWSYPRANAEGKLDPNKLFVLCTTCHNPHGTAGVQTSYFFLNSPYNPNAKFDPQTRTSSTTQFCRQCHFSLSNEYNGLRHVRTAF